MSPANEVRLRRIRKQHRLSLNNYGRPRMRGTLNDFCPLGAEEFLERREGTI